MSELLRKIIGKIDDTGLITTVKINTEDEQLVNLLRRSIMHNIPVYGIGYVRFITRKTARIDEVLATRLGQLPVIQDSFEHPTEDTDFFKATIDVSGPVVLTSDHINGIKIKGTYPIAELLEGDSLYCELYMMKSNGYDHVNFRPVSTVGMRKEDFGFTLSFKNLGMMSSEEIINLAVEYNYLPLDRTTYNMFFVPLIPKNMKY